MRLKEDYLKVLADYKYASEQIKKEDNIHYQWAKETLPQIDIDRCVAWRRLQLLVECVFEMNIDALHSYEVAFGNNNEVMKAALDIYYCNSKIDMSCYSLIVDIYILRDLDYYEKYVDDESILSDISSVYTVNEFGVANLNELRDRLTEHIESKQLPGSDFYPIASCSIEFSEKDIIERDLDDLIGSIISRINNGVESFKKALDRESYMTD